MTTPRDMGFRMPAEWEPHAATWLSWPHNVASWPGKFDKILPVYAYMAAALAESEPVHINVNDVEMERLVKSHLQRAGARGEIHFHHFPTNDAWCRDHGAIFVVDAGLGSAERIAAVNWDFNAWGGKYPYELDRAIPALMASALDVPLFQPNMILEGGSIDVNGRGLLLTTESCLLNPNRNPQLDRGEIEQRLRAYLGVEELIWLGDGIAGDDTDGHIDDMTRFVAEDVVVTVVEPNSDDENFRPLTENLTRLKRWRGRDGAGLNVVELPMPPAVMYEGERLPASYANFYIANGIILLPGYDSRTDDAARRIMAELFPTREIVTIDCTDLVWGLGAFHCLTQQVPA